jgi:hypothetical protein
MMDRVFNLLFVLAVALLAFVGGAWVMLAERFPADWLRDAHLAARAVLQQSADADDPHASDLWREARSDRRGVTLIDAPRMQPGYTLYTSGHLQGALLIDAAGNVVHEWTLPYQQIWDAQSSSVHNPVAGSHIYFRKAVLYPNGDLLAVYDGIGDTPHGYGLVKLDRDSRPIWKYLRNAHHDVDIAPDGRVFALTHEIVDQVFEPRLHLKPPRIDDFVVELSADGEELRKIPLLQAHVDTPYLRLLDRSPWYLANSGDYLHTNTIDYIDAGVAAHFDFAEEGQLLLSMRETGAIAVLDPDSGKLVWAMRGSWVGQHDPDLLDNGHILLFDNNGRLSEHGQSRVVEIDPRTEQVVWSYAGSAEAPLDSRIRSAQQRLANGNTLITESDGGRLLEVTEGGEIVWEYLNPVRGGPGDRLIPVVSWGQRIDADGLETAFREQLEQQNRRTRS